VCLYDAEDLTLGVPKLKGNKRVVTKINNKDSFIDSNLGLQGLDDLVSNQARLPAELKHINKRRKRN
jgi:hypothetical protein